MQPLSDQTNIHELERLHRGSYQVVSAQSEGELILAVDHLLQDSPYTASMLLVKGTKLEAATTNTPGESDKLKAALGILESSILFHSQAKGVISAQTYQSNAYSIDIVETEKFLSGKPIIISEDSSTSAVSLKLFTNQLNYRSCALLSIKQGNNLAGILVLGSQTQSLTDALIQPYIGTTELIGATLDKIAVIQNKENRIRDLQTSITQSERLSLSSIQIIDTQSKDELIQVAGRILQDTPFSFVMFLTFGSELKVVYARGLEGWPSLQKRAGNLNLSLDDVRKYLSGSPVIIEEGSMPWPIPLRQLKNEFNYETVASLPILHADQMNGLIVLGGQKASITSELIQPYIVVADLIGIALEKIRDISYRQKRIHELEAITMITEAGPTSSDLDSFYATLHAQVKNIIGDYPFVVALYEKSTDSIVIPYIFEEGKVGSIEALPLGENLTSILIRSHQPLLLVEDTEKQAEKLGVKTQSKPAKSWMGAPMIIRDEVVGALLVQDQDHEYAFNNEQLRFLEALANHGAGVIYNFGLLEDGRRRAIQLETAAQIARDISGSLNLDDLLKKAVNLIRERFNFYHAGIFLIDLPGEFAVIREATGEAGSQMKRAGHKLGVGSKSIVGYVAGRGDSLIVNDTANDSTYYANPLLPETRAEAAIPLKVGERIVGVLDVQSIEAFVFNDDNLRTFQTLADQLAIAVVNSELFAETQEYLSQHRLLHHITSTAASGTTLEEALESAVSGLQVTLGGDRVSILMHDTERKFLEVKASVGYSQEVDKIRIPIGSGITGWVAEHHRLLRVDDVKEDARYIQASANTRSELAVPLMYRNEILGVLNVESEQVAAYNENDEEMLGTLGGSLAAIIANARLVEQVRNQAEYSRLIYEITSKIRRSTDMQTILTTTASELTKAVGARYAKIEIAPENNGNGAGLSQDRSE